MATDTQIRQFAEEIQAIAGLEGFERKQRIVTAFRAAVQWLLPNRSEDIVTTLAEFGLPPKPGEENFDEMAYPLGFHLLVAARNAIQSDPDLETELNRAFDAVLTSTKQRPNISISEWATEFIDSPQWGRRPTNQITRAGAVESIERAFKNNDIDGNGAAK